MAFETILPGLIAFGFGIYFLLLYVGERDDEFNHNKMLIFMAVGMIVGTFFLILEMPFSGSWILLAFVALLEEMTKFIILNRKKYQGEISTIWYGASMGFIMGAIISAEMMYLSPPGNAPGEKAYWVISFTAIAFSYTLMHGATGALIGYGSATNSGMKFLWKAFFIHFLLALIPFVPIPKEYTLLLMAAYSGFNYLRVRDIIYSDRERFKIERISG